MHQATKLSPADRTAVEVSLARLAGDAFGSLATLPLYCTGELPAPDPRALILDHFDVWRSCLIVVREVMKSNGFTSDEMPAAVEAMLKEITAIRDAYIAIQADHNVRPQEALDVFEQLECGYGRLAPLIRELGAALDLETTFLAGDRSLKQLTYSRTLRSFGEQLARGAGK